ncbi:uncharacterized protein [Oryza sativa Japonica Group]
MHNILMLILFSPHMIISGGYSLMGCIKDILTLKGDNYAEWKRKLDLAFILGDVDWVLTTPCPIEPAELIRGENESDADWQKRQRDNAPLVMSYDIEQKKWSLANKKCLAVVKNTIEPTILGSIPECDAVSEYLERIKSQFTGSSKTYATQLIKQLVTERYHGGGVRDHILRMSNMASKLKPMDLGITDDFLVHLVMASLPKQFDNFIVNYNISPEKWNFEKLIANCVQEEERIKESNGCSINYVKDNKKKNHKSSPTSKAKQSQHLPQQQQFAVEKDQCLHCKKTGHYKKDCPDFLKMIMARKDHYFRYGYIYPIKERSEALDKFKIFKAEVENQHDIKIKVVRSNRGGEYYGRHTPYGQVHGPFARFLLENGIVAQYSTPGEPQQNGVAERRNRTLMDMVRSMMSYSTLPLAPVVTSPVATMNENEEPVIQDSTEMVATPEEELQQPQIDNVPVQETQQEPQVQDVPNVQAPRSLLTTIIPKLYTLISGQYNLEETIRQDIRSIKNELDMMLSAIQDYSSLLMTTRSGDGRHHHQLGAGAVQATWIEKVRTLAHQMEDCIDSYIYDQMAPHGSRRQGPARFASEVRELRSRSAELSQLNQQYGAAVLSRE